MVSSLYDPLGFLAPFSVPAKLLLQELCRRKLQWDEVISHDFSKQWAEWLQDLQQMDEFKVERCIKPRDFGVPVSAQLSGTGGSGHRYRVFARQNMFINK